MSEYLVLCPPLSSPLRQPELQIPMEDISWDKNANISDFSRPFYPPPPSPPIWRNKIWLVLRNPTIKLLFRINPKVWGFLPFMFSLCYQLYQSRHMVTLLISHCCHFQFMGLHPEKMKLLGFRLSKTNYMIGVVEVVPPSYQGSRCKVKDGSWPSADGDMTMVVCELLHTFLTTTTTKTPILIQLPTTTTAPPPPTTTTTTTTTRTSSQQWTGTPLLLTSRLELMTFSYKKKEILSFYVQNWNIILFNRRFTLNEEKPMILFRKIFGFQWILKKILF